MRAAAEIARDINCSLPVDCGQFKVKNRLVLLGFNKSRFPIDAVAAALLVTNARSRSINMSHRYVSYFFFRFCT